jgi:hypothetical protein
MPILRGETAWPTLDRRASGANSGLGTLVFPTSDTLGEEEHDVHAPPRARRLRFRRLQ